MPLYTSAVAPEYTEKLDALRKRMFLAAGERGELKLGSFRPATGIGNFDAVYDPKLHRLDITIKLFFYFHTLNVPSPYSTNKSEAAFTPQEILQFPRDAKRVIEETWSERYTLACAKPGWLDQYADVYVHVEEAQRGQEHFIVDVHKLNAYKSSGGISTAHEPPVCLVNNGANEVDMTKKQGLAFNYKEALFRGKLRESVQDQTGDFVEFRANSITLDMPHALRLSRWVQYVATNREGTLKGIKAYVIGLTGKPDSILARGLAKGRAAVVVEHLNGRMPGGDFALAASADEPWAKEFLAHVKRRPRNHTNGGPGGALIVLRTGTGVVRELFQTYVVMAHEAGHMLGLPDEYWGVQHEATLTKMKLDGVIPSTFMAAKALNSQVRAEQQQGKFTAELSRTNVPSPLFMGMTDKADHEVAGNIQKTYTAFSDRRDLETKKMNGTQYKEWEKRNPAPQSPTESMATTSTSIMHSGEEILPAHYVTVWSALAQITAGYIDPDEWKIVPSKKGPSTLRNFK